MFLYSFDCFLHLGMTPLMLGCHSASPQMLNIVQYLLDRGANVDLKDAEGQTGKYRYMYNDKSLLLFYVCVVVRTLIHFY